MAVPSIEGEISLGWSDKEEWSKSASRAGGRMMEAFT